MKPNHFTITIGFNPDTPTTIPVNVYLDTNGVLTIHTPGGSWSLARVVEDAEKLKLELIPFIGDPYIATDNQGCIEVVK